VLQERLREEWRARERAVPVHPVMTFAKSIVNPGNPTPTYMGYSLPKSAGSVAFDDCERSTGTMVEIKDGYAGFLNSDLGRAFVARIFMKQAINQVKAAEVDPSAGTFHKRP
jgi:hypothetical protein